MKEVLILGYGESLQILSDIIKSVDAKEKIVSERTKKTTNGDTNIIRSISNKGKRLVTEEFKNVLFEKHDKVKAPGKAYIFKGKDDDIFDFFFDSIIKEALDFISNPNTAKIAYGRLQ